MPSFLSICYLYLAFISGGQNLFLDHGVYPLESDNNGKFRWTDGDVRVLLSPERREITLGLRHKDIEPIDICVDDVCTSSKQKQNFDLTNCNSVTLLDKNYCRHSIKITDTWVPAETIQNSTDRRRLGTRIRY